MKTRTAERLALCSGVLSGLFAAITLAVMILGWSAGVPFHESNPLVNVVITLAFATVGALVAWRRPENAVGWLLCAIGLVIALGGLCDAYAIHAVFGRQEPTPGVGLAAWVSILSAMVGILSFLLLLLLFPNGVPPSRRWWRVAWLIVGVIVAESMVGTFGPERFVGYRDLKNPLHIAVLDPLLDLYARYAQLPLLALAVLLTVAGLVVRFRRSPAPERQQLKWVAGSGMFAAFALILFFSFGGQEQSLALESILWSLLVLALCGIPASIGVAILRYRLYDIDAIINRTLVYGSLSAVVAGTYVLVVGGLGTLLQARGNLLISLFATGLIAVLFAPLRARLQRGVDHLMYGERDDPYAVISRLGRLETTLAPEALLPAVVETVKDSLKVPYAAITLRVGATSAAEVGTPVEKPLRLQLMYRREPVGELLLGPRAGEEDFSDADRRLLEDLARQAGVAVRAVRLTADLQRSRERLVAAREEERRRLRRDLHDGLGAQLAGLNVQAGTLRRLIPRDPAAADELVVELRDELRAAIADIRRLVYDLRPPALDDLGLVEALRRLAERYGSEGEQLRVMVEASEDLPNLPAAVEVAVYRIAQEALTNVARHARARTCVVRLVVNEDVALDIVDDGVGIPAERGAGVGLSSMRERAAELGGSCIVESAPEGGTRVLVRLPLPKE
jgi:signal transduction histidine kinase